MLRVLADIAIQVYHGSMSSIAFIGFRGSGKSTLGKWLAAVVDKEWIDTDVVVLAHLDFSTVEEAWESVGEEGWRKAELLLIPSILEQSAVVSLGGGAPMLPDIAQSLAKCHVVFHLVSNEDVTLQRISEGKDRPALEASDVEMLRKRLPKYASLSTYTIDTSSAIAQSKANILEYLDSLA